MLLPHFWCCFSVTKVDDALKHRIQGFINAGEFLNLLSREEAISIINKAHIAVFGITKEQRKAHSEAIKAVIKGGDDSVFDIPAVERLSGR